MPYTIKVRASACRNLSSRQEVGVECFVELSVGEAFRQKTAICQKSLNPTWEETFRLEVNDLAEIETSPLKIEVCEAEGNSFGCFYLDLSVLLGNRAGGSSNGWFPLYDTLKGMGGQVHLAVVLDEARTGPNLALAEELSIGINIFTISSKPHGTSINRILGLAEEIVVVYDPEYDWKALIRSSRYSNETRRTVLQAASMQARSALRRKVRSMGGNAILGYREYAELEGDKTDRICIRALGTAVKLREDRNESFAEETHLSESFTTVESAKRISTGESMNMRTTQPIPPSGRLLKGGRAVQLVTLKRLPAVMDVQLGGLVIARSVKLLTPRLTQEQRQDWWVELRSEIQSHASSMGCDAVLGYNETVTFDEDVCILSASGTGAILKDCDNKKLSCALLHATFEDESIGLNSELSSCGLCGISLVPSMLLTTIEVPSGLHVLGRGIPIRAISCRKLRRLNAEQFASDASKCLPFLELEIHRQLILKLRIAARNAIFGLQFNIALGPSCIVGTAFGSAVCLNALPLHDLEVRRAPGQSPVVVHERSKSHPNGHSNVSQRSRKWNRFLRKSSRRFNRELKNTSFKDPNSLDVYTTLRQRTEDNIKLLAQASTEVTSAFEDGLPSDIQAIIPELGVDPPDIYNQHKLTDKGVNLFLEIDNDVDTKLAHNIYMEPQFPPDFTVSTLNKLPGLIYLPESYPPFVYAVKRVELTEEIRSDSDKIAFCVGKAANDLIAEALVRQALAGLITCCLSAARLTVGLVDDEAVEIVLTAHSLNYQLKDFRDTPYPPSNILPNSLTILAPKVQHSTLSLPFPPSFVLVTPLDSLPGKTVIRYLGLVSIHLIKETTSLKNSEAFCHELIMDGLRTARAHVTALGGNILLGFRINNLLLKEEKSQAYAVLSACGDAAQAEL